MAKINHEEYEILKNLDDDWEWIVRGEDSNRSIFPNELWLYQYTSKKGIQNWLGGGGATKRFCYDDLFQFIQWEDKEPYNIQELIEEYESEETEMSDLKWLKEEVSEILLTSKKDGTNYFYYRDLKEKIYNAIDKIDEPEVLSSDWINDNVEYAYYMTPRGTYSSAKAVIDPNKLENILVPKQEEMKVSKMWHDIIVQNKEDGHSLRWTLDYVDNLNVNDVDSFAKAWLAYPNIELEEEEQKYYIDLETAAYVAKWDGNGQVDIYTDGISGSDEFEFHLTEQEIKDFDERFWPFRKPAEEVE